MKISHAREKRQGRGREGRHPGESAGAAREAVHTELGDPAGQDGRPAPGPREAHLAPRPWAAPAGTDLPGVFLPEVPDVHVILVHRWQVQEGERE